MEHDCVRALHPSIPVVDSMRNSRESRTAVDRTFGNMYIANEYSFIVTRVTT